jgi:hypothetical protein
MAAGRQQAEDDGVLSCWPDLAMAADDGSQFGMHGGDARWQRRLQRMLVLV